ncbi:hypothetical protein L484_010167 [Morus notabilis]|uniref:Uncharacterized protein n=1 Tax=Morus notabilis TaxID=981085 RepID=W9R9D5_9ROSA|nr:hypothetical protein L484_010167 [Morus notabilis]
MGSTPLNETAATNTTTLPFFRPKHKLKRVLMICPPYRFSQSGARDMWVKLASGAAIDEGSAGASASVASEGIVRGERVE